MKPTKKQNQKNALLLEEFEKYLEVVGVFVKEYRFHPKRLWRFDYACIDTKTAIEIEGGIYIAGRHTRGKGYQQDLTKYNNATALGWRVYRFSYKDLERKTYLNYIY